VDLQGRFIKALDSSGQEVKKDDLGEWRPKTNGCFG